MRDQRYQIVEDLAAAVKSRVRLLNNRNVCTPFRNFTRLVGSVIQINVKETA